MKKLFFGIFPLLIVSGIFLLFIGVNSNNTYKDLIGVKYTLKKDQNVISTLRRAGIDPAIRDSVIMYLEKHIDMKKCMPGEDIYIYTDSDMHFRYMEYHKNIVDVYIVEHNDNAFNSYRKPTEKRINTAYVSGTIKKNLYETIIALGESPKLAQLFSSIFSWQIDCNSEAQKHGTFEILVEKIYINGNFYDYGKILYASLDTDKRLYEGFYYNNNGEEAYLDMEGNSLSDGLLRAPMAFYTRISSGYTQSRYHPVLKKYMPHKAIDYAAPRGTPVYAAGDGKITKKFYDRYGGRCIYIEHDDGYLTEYMHLHSYAKISVPGQYVKKGDIIGYVGKTGTATGNHLHFAVRHNGVYINPRHMQFQSSFVLSEADMETFHNYRNIVYNLLFATKSFISFPTYCSKKQYLFEYASINSQSPGL